MAATSPVSDLARQLGAIWRRDRARLAITYCLTVVENVCALLLPAAIGLAVDGLLAGRAAGVLPLALVWMFHLAVGLFRHLYDTRVFTRIYASLATETVERLRARAVPASRVVGRVALSREIVDFFEAEVPAMASLVISFVGAVAMLFVYDWLIGLFALLALAPILGVNTWFAERATRLNGGLNNRLEMEPEIVARRPVPLVRNHFRRLRFWRIAISNAEAATWGAVELVCLALTLATLLRLTGVDGATAGTVYAVLAYVWSFYEAVNDLPNIIQNVARVKDIGRRIAGDTGSPAPQKGMSA